MRPPSRYLGKALGIHIATHRKQRQLTQAELAELVGIDTVSLSRIETGTVLPSLARLSALADALDIDITRRGTHFKLTGDTQHMRMAAQMLENFYIRAKNPIDLEEIQLGLVEIDKLKPEDVASSNAPVLMTRRSELHGRTPRQIAY